MTEWTSCLRSLCDADAGAAFDAFAGTGPFAAYQQSRAWAQAAPAAKHKDWLIFLCRDGAEVIGTALIRRTWLGPWRWLATVQRGPVVQDPAKLGAVLDRLVADLRRARCCSLQLAPRIRGRDLPHAAETIRQAGFAPLPPRRQPLHVATGIVWLDKPEADILAGFKQRGRRQIRAAAKAGVTVRAVTDAADIARYQALIDLFRRNRPDYDMSGLPDAAGQAALIADRGGAMLLAEREGVAIGGHAFVRQADEAIWLSLVTDDAQAATGCSYALLWAAMRAARAAGCVGYDLAGMPVGATVDAGEIGRAQFKTAFAPHRRILLPMQIRAIRPLDHVLLFSARQAYRMSRLRRLTAGRRRPAAKEHADVVR
ncbi:MAG TPA: GNAT family N-acetyltransferase [Sphingomonas sp.]|jgi:lipid II:glycine glycyltransferase (peptidoglycan interpeptide bridge formation enzyme)|uniref:GNAT family N-acetyltransferase n=1 Tax=Sphingomonas sp. TaxID=28214 RepID=UPI002EDB5FBD